MSKVLILPGTNFSANKVATIVIGEPVPCTGLSLDQSAYEFDAPGASFTLAATKVPANTTDALTWASSDETVAKVVDGVVTCEGVGTATITATCGNQTATCSITTDLSVTIGGDDYVIGNGYILSENGEADYIGIYAYYKGRIMASAEQTGDYYGWSTSETGYVENYPIMIPKNASSMEMVVPTDFNNVTVIFLDSKQQTSAALNPKTSKKVGKSYGYPSSQKYTAQIPEEADSYVLNYGGSNDPASITTPVVVKYS